MGHSAHKGRSFFANSVQWIFLSRTVYCWPPTTSPRSANLIKKGVDLKKIAQLDLKNSLQLVKPDEDNPPEEAEKECVEIGGDAYVP